LQAALGLDDDSDDDEETVRVQAASVLLSEGLRELTEIRKILQQAFKE
jgi:hypothetical protein